MAERPVSGSFGLYRFYVRADWLPASSAALAIGAIGLFHAARTVPRPDGQGRVFTHFASAAATDVFLSPAVVFFLAAMALLLGLPSLYTLMPRGSYVGILGLVLMAFAALVMVGFAQQLLLVHSTVDDEVLSEAQVAGVVAEFLSGNLLNAALVSMWLGELILALVFVRQGVVPGWISVALILHIVLGILSRAMEGGGLGVLPPLLMAAGLAGAAVHANRSAQVPGVSSTQVARQHLEHEG